MTVSVHKRGVHPWDTTVQVLFWEMEGKRGTTGVSRIKPLGSILAETPKASGGGTVGVLEGERGPFHTIREERSLEGTAPYLRVSGGRPLTTSKDLPEKSPNGGRTDGKQGRGPRGFDDSHIVGEEPSD